MATVVNIASYRAPQTAADRDKSPPVLPGEVIDFIAKKAARQWGIKQCCCIGEALDRIALADAMHSAAWWNYSNLVDDLGEDAPEAKEAYQRYRILHYPRIEAVHSLMLTPAKTRRELARKKRYVNAFGGVREWRELFERDAARIEALRPSKKHGRADA